MKYTRELVSNSVDFLQLRGIKLINKNGKRLETSGHGYALQMSHVNYVLEPFGDTYDRINTWRKPTELHYLANEILFYFSGSLHIFDAIRASKAWLKMADENNKIASNYGNMVFHKKKRSSKYFQYEQSRNKLLKNKHTRRSVIIILNPYHNMDGPDYPCTFDIHFIIEQDKLNCIVSSRSLDVITGLPYDMAFFSFINEMMWKDLMDNGMEINLGYTMIKANLTQIYDKTSHFSEQILQTASQTRRKRIWMPKVDSPKLILQDIHSDSSDSIITKWCNDNSYQFEKPS